MKISRETLHQLIENKLCQAGLKREHAATVAEIIGLRQYYRGIHSHGAVRMEYYAERIEKAAPTTGVSSRGNRAVLGAVPTMLPDGCAAKMGMEHAIKTTSKKALRWSLSAGWVTAAQSLILCSRQPTPD